MINTSRTWSKGCTLLWHVDSLYQKIAEDCDCMFYCEWVVNFTVSLYLPVTDVWSSVCMCGRRWQSIFHLRIWGSLAQFWNRVFLTMIIILIVLFLGKWKQQVCQVFSYSLVDTVGNNSNLELWPAADHWRLCELLRFEIATLSWGGRWGICCTIWYCYRIGPYNCGQKFKTEG